MLDLSCLAAAGLFVLSDIFGAVAFHAYTDRHMHFNFTAFEDLDPAYLQSEWQFRLDNRRMELPTALLNALAWIVFCLPILQLAWIQSHRGTRQLGLHVALAGLALAGSISEMLATLFYIGSTNATEWLASSFNLDSWVTENDGVGWRVLEVAYIVTEGLALWVDAVEWFFLSVILLMIFWSVRSSESLMLFSQRWALLGLVVAAFCFLDFAAELLRFRNWRRYSHISFFITILSHFVLFPVWLIALGRMLPKALDAMHAPSAANMVGGEAAPRPSYGSGGGGGVTVEMAKSSSSGVREHEPGASQFA